MKDCTQLRILFSCLTIAECMKPWVRDCTMLCIYIYIYIYIYVCVCVCVHFEMYMLYH